MLNESGATMRVIMSPEEKRLRHNETNRLSYLRNIEKKREYAHKYYIEHKDQCDENRREWLSNNGEKRKEYERRYRTENHDELCERAHQWYTENRERRRETNKKWRIENPEKSSAHMHKWRAENPDFNIKYRQEFPEKHRETEQRRRTRKKGGVCENINSIEIYERDNWTCQICHEAVGRELKWPNPKSASLDHIIAIAMGGSHTEGNVQLAHLRCNIKAGVKAVRMAA